MVQLVLIVCWVELHKFAVTCRRARKVLLLPMAEAHQRVDRVESRKECSSFSRIFRTSVEFSLLMSLDRDVITALFE
jgi:hypothetical protein